MSLALGAIGALGAAVAGVLTYGVATPQSCLFGPVISRRNADSGNDIALTFDDGPHPDATMRVLDVLGELNVKAAFFMIGRNICKAEHVVARVHEDGHIVANHTYQHSYLGTFGLTGYWRREINHTNEMIDRIIGHRPALFRPPMGLKTPYVLSAAGLERLTAVTWSRRALDGINTTQDRIVRRLIDTVQSGDIVTMHDGIDHSSNRNLKATISAIKPLVAAWQSRNLELVRLDNLLGLDAYQN